MKKQLWLLLFLLLPYLVIGQHVRVPAYINFADISIKLSDRAQHEIQQKVNALHRNQKYFKRKVDLAAVYFPLIEQVLQQEGVPADFKFLALQESGLIGDTVSRSFAVGYWQFKQEAASDFNLRMDEQVDERMHLIEATRGAAQYMKRSNKYYKNWLNSLLSYSLGFNGAKVYTRPSEIGNRRLEVTEKTHPYLLTFLAHKIAYENFVQKTDVSAGVVLQLMPVKPGQTLFEIAQATKTNVAELGKYNKWLLNDVVPDGKNYVMLVPVSSESDNTTTYTLSDAKTPASETKAITAANANRLHTVMPGDTLYQLSRKYNIPLEQLRRLNNLRNNNIKIGHTLLVAAPGS